jgi:predicted RNase H-like HicB family nuclease
MGIENYKAILYRQESGGWVAEIISIPGCYTLMNTREAALTELAKVFALIEKSTRKKGQAPPSS